MENSRSEVPLRVVLADDDPMVLELFLAWLDGPEWNVSTALSGVDALSLLDREPFDLVVADLLMPGMGGLELLRAVRAPNRERTPYFILVTGNSDPRILEHAFEAGVDDFIGKPCSRIEFLARVRAAHRMRTLAQEIAQRTECDFERRLVEGSAREFREVVTTLAHDLRTPIGALRTTAETLAAILHDAPPQVERLTRRIQSLTVHLADTVRDVTDAFVCDDTDGPRWEEFDLLEQVRAAAELVRGSVGEGVDLVVLDGEPCPMKGSALGLRRLCLNMLSNAVRATRAGHVVAGLEPDPTDPRWVRLRFTDTGGGIPAEILPLLGQPLALSNGTHRTRFSSEGSGLGIAVCRRIAARHGGRLRIESSPGKGTGIEFLLRVDLDQPSSDFDFAPMDALLVP